MDDKCIIELFNTRSEQALSEVQTKYGNLCGKIAYNILNNYEDAEECVIESYVKLWNSIPPKEPTSLCGYLCRIVRNTAITVYKKLSRHIYDEQFDELAEILPSTYDTERSFDLIQTADYINEYLLHTTRKKRIVFVARYYYNMSINDIAVNTGISDSAVKSILMRTRRSLRAFLTERGVDI